MNIVGRKILVTGGASGIGFALAKKLFANGNDVIVCGRRRSALDDAQNKIPGLMIRECDVSKSEDIDSMAKWLNENHADLSVLINNAGVQHRRRFDEADALLDLESEIAINLTGPIKLIGKLLPLLKENKDAMIVNVSSGLAFSPAADVPVYCATKSAMHSFTMSLRYQMKKNGIQVVEMVPPIVSTDLGGGTRTESSAKRAMISPEQFAEDAIAQWNEGALEILVGMSVDTRRLGESLFDRMNP